MYTAAVFPALLGALTLLTGCSGADTPELSPTPEEEQATQPDELTGTPTSNPTPTPSSPPTETPAPPRDLDGDGVDVPEDCDDADSTSYPGASELCDGVNNDCDSSTVEAGLATFFGLDDEPVDLTALLAGTAGSPAVYASTEAGSLLLCEGTWYVNLSIRHDISIVGLEGSASTLLHGGEQSSVLRVEAGNTRPMVELQGLTLERGEAPMGGGLYLDEADVTGRDILVQYNHASTQGGGIYLTGAASVALEDSTLLENAATDSGGGLYLDSGTVTLNASVIRLNHSDSHDYDNNGGGGIRAVGGEVFLNDVVLDSNTSIDPGGAIRLTDAPVYLTNTSIVGNRADFGGAIAAFGSSTVTMVGGEVSNNTASLGGGIYASGSATRVDLDAVQVVHNVANTQGGGIWINAASLKTTGVSLQSNEVINSTNISDQGGGGLWCRSSDDVQVAGGRVEENQAHQAYGGGILAYACDLTLEGVVIVGNDAFESGGGILAADSSTATLIGSEVETNNAAIGGGICLLSSSALTLSDGSAILGNTATGSGGGIYAEKSSDVALTDAVVLGNTAYSHGGGILLSTSILEATRLELSNNRSLNTNDDRPEYGGGGLRATDSTISVFDAVIVSNNTSETYGGGVILEDTSIVWTGTSSLLSGNSAGLNGGGLQLVNGSTVMLDGFTISDNVAEASGGGISAQAVAKEVLVRNVLLLRNTASKNGGGVYAENSWVTLESSSLDSNKAGSQGHGAAGKSLTAARTLGGNAVTFSGTPTQIVYHLDLGKPFTFTTPASFTCDNLGCF